MAAGHEPEEEDALVLLAQAGDATAMERLFARDAQALRARIALRLPALARGKISESDVVQEAYLTAFERLGDFECRTSDGFRRWLFRIVDFKVREQVRRWLSTAKRSAGREVRLTAGAGGVEAASRSRSPSTSAQDQEERTEVLGALARLEGEDRAILDLVHRQGLSFPEAGDRLTISAEAARKRHGRALGRLGALVRARIAP